MVVHAAYVTLQGGGDRGAVMATIPEFASGSYLQDIFSCHTFFSIGHFHLQYPSIFSIFCAASEDLLSLHCWLIL